MSLYKDYLKKVYVTRGFEIPGRQFKIEGRPVKIKEFEDVDFFIHRPIFEGNIGNECWVISEKVSGFTISIETTQARAKESAYNKLKRNIHTQKEMFAFIINAAKVKDLPKYKGE